MVYHSYRSSPKSGDSNGKQSAEDAAGARGWKDAVHGSYARKKKIPTDLALPNLTELLKIIILKSS